MELDLPEALQFASGASSGICAEGPRISRRTDISELSAVSPHLILIPTHASAYCFQYDWSGVNHSDGSLAHLERFARDDTTYRIYN